MAFVHGGKRYATPHQITSELLRLIEGESLFTDGYIAQPDDEPIPVHDVEPDDERLDDIEGEDLLPKVEEPGPLLKFLYSADSAIRADAKNLALLQGGVRSFVDNLSLPDEMGKVVALHGRLKDAVPEAIDALADACAEKGYPFVIMETLSLEEDEANGLADPAVYKNIAVLFDQAKKEVTVFISDEHREVTPVEFLIEWHKNPPEGYLKLDADGNEKDPELMVYAVNELLNKLQAKTADGSDARRAVDEAIGEYRKVGRQLGYTLG